MLARGIRSWEAAGRAVCRLRRNLRSRFQLCRSSAKAPVAQPGAFLFLECGGSAAAFRVLPGGTKVSLGGVAACSRAGAEPPALQMGSAVLGFLKHGRSPALSPLDTALRGVSPFPWTCDSWNRLALTRTWHCNMRFFCQGCGGLSYGPDETRAKQRTGK